MHGHFFHCKKCLKKKPGQGSALVAHSGTVEFAQGCPSKEDTACPLLVERETISFYYMRIMGGFPAMYTSPVDCKTVRSAGMAASYAGCIGKSNVRPKVRKAIDHCTALHTFLTF